MLVQPPLGSGSLAVGGFPGMNGGASEIKPKMTFCICREAVLIASFAVVLQLRSCFAGRRRAL